MPRAHFGNFSGEVSVKDGNTVLVITKKSGFREYETNSDDCGYLASIIMSINDYLEKEKDRIQAPAE